MLTAGFFLLFSIVSSNAANLHQQVRLTQEGTRTAQIVPENVQYSGRQTYGTVTKPMGYRVENQEPNIDGIFQYPYNVNEAGFQHNHNSNHQHNHNHELTHNRPELSGQLGGEGRTNSPSKITTNRNIYRMNQTTERYNRDAQPINNPNGGLSFNANVNNPRNTKDHQMVFPNERDISRVFGKPSPPQTPYVKPLNPRSPPKNCTYSLCDEVDDYPEQRILRIIENSKDLKQYFTNVVSNGPDFILNRFGDDENALCPTMVHTQFPRSAPNTENEERILVNVGEYKQGIVFETCANEGSPCKFSEAFPNDITTTCKQKYTVRRLMTVGKESDKAVFDNFHLPSCCVCVTKKN